MGWLKSIGRSIGRKVENAGRKWGIGIIEKAGKKIQDVCSETSRKVSEMDEYDKERANMHQTVKMNEILASFSIGLQGQADSIEKNCISEVQAYYRELIKTIDKTNSDIGTRRLKSSLREMKRSIDGSIKNHLAKRVSLDDRECLKILEMDSGKDKEIAMSKFGKKVISEALDTLSKEIANIANIQNDEIKDYLEDLLEKQNKEFEMMQSQFDQILKQSKEEVNDKETSTVTPKLLVEISESVISGF